MLYFSRQIDGAFSGHGNVDFEKSGDFPQFLQTLFRHLINSTDLLERFNNDIQALLALLKAIGETMAVFTHPRCDISAYRVNAMGECTIVANNSDGRCHINDVKM